MNPFLNPLITIPFLKNYIVDPNRIERLSPQHLDNYRDKALKKMDLLWQALQNGELIDFPYLFNPRLVMRCASNIDELKINTLNRIAGYLALSLDHLLARRKESSLYRWVRSSNLLSTIYHKLTSRMKSIRGDGTATIASKLENRR